MKIVLLAGSSNQNLWPLANRGRADQFVPLLEHPSGGRESSTQRIWRQLERADLQENAYIAAGIGQTELVHKQLGTGAPVIKEPAERGTYSAALLSAAYLHSIVGLSMNEVIVFIPANIYVGQSFFDCVRSLPKLLRSSSSQLILIGVKAGEQERPGSKGVIITESGGEEADFCSKVIAYNGKPQDKEAIRLQRAGALLHSGAFAFRLGSMIDKLMEEGLPVRYEELFKIYARLEPRSCRDYIGSGAEASVIEYSGEWKELGTWEAVAEYVPNGRNGKLMGCGKQTVLLNELDVPLSVCGLSDTVVAASREGILVANLASLERKRLADLIPVKDTTEMPMSEDRRWGKAEVLSRIHYGDGHEAAVKLMRMRAGEHLDYELHLRRDEKWTILNGEAELMLDECCSRVKTGDTVDIPARARHSMRALTDLEWVELQLGPGISQPEDQIVISTVWEEIRS
ncbi:mannose-1-phosphate guanylyltransferase [Paenibacillus thailandensis]|uniref:Mannose-1-phosphate guanylyltransferase n=1 Tax=Paenibacillus thailandensis TaxID=393250 RepID=A0ABW5QT66_9BACL